MDYMAGSVYFNSGLANARLGLWTAVTFPNNLVPGYGLDPSDTPVKVVPHNDLTQLDNAVAQHRDGWISR
jgi:hypothetical protein